MGYAHHIRKTTAWLVLVAFFLNNTGTGFAQVAPVLPWMPEPGVQVALTPGYKPAVLHGMTIVPHDPFRFDFIVSPGDNKLAGDARQVEYKKLVKYFLAALATPDTNQWVNLSPYEKDRIIPDNFGLTEMGRDLLAQDYLLKQISASLTNPDSELGKKFWDAVYQEARMKFGTTEVPTNVFSKVWITPDKAVVYEKNNSVIVVESHLKVMTETDYLAMKNNHSEAAASAPQALTSIPAATPDNVAEISLRVMREVIIPALEKEINEGKAFAALRQIYSGMLLATWYKMSMKQTVLGKLYADQSKTRGVDQDPATNTVIYKKYLAAFQKGVFNFIKEDVDRFSQEVIPRKYFSGGANNKFNEIIVKLTDPAKLPAYVTKVDVLIEGDLEMAVKFALTDMHAWTDGFLDEEMAAMPAKYKDFDHNANTVTLRRPVMGTDRQGLIDTWDGRLAARAPQARVESVNEVMRSINDGRTHIVGFRVNVAGLEADDDRETVAEHLGIPVPTVKGFQNTGGKVIFRYVPDAPSMPGEIQAFEKAFQVLQDEHSVIFGDLTAAVNIGEVLVETMPEIRDAIEAGFFEEKPPVHWRELAQFRKQVEAWQIEAAAVDAVATVRKGKATVYNASNFETFVNAAVSDIALDSLIAVQSELNQRTIRGPGGKKDELATFIAARIDELEKFIKKQYRPEIDGAPVITRNVLTPAGEAARTMMNDLKTVQARIERDFSQIDFAASNVVVKIENALKGLETSRDHELKEVHHGLMRTLALKRESIFLTTELEGLEIIDEWLTDVVIKVGELPVDVRNGLEDVLADIRNGIMLKHENKIVSRVHQEFLPTDLFGKDFGIVVSKGVFDIYAESGTFRKVVPENRSGVLASGLSGALGMNVSSDAIRNIVVRNGSISFSLSANAGRLLAAQVINVLTEAPVAGIKADLFRVMDRFDLLDEEKNLLALNGWFEQVLFNEARPLPGALKKTLLDVYGKVTMELGRVHDIKTPSLIRSDLLGAGLLQPNGWVSIADNKVTISGAKEDLVKADKPVSLIEASLKRVMGSDKKVVITNLNISDNGPISFDLAQTAADFITEIEAYLNKEIKSGYKSLQPSERVLQLQSTLIDEFNRVKTAASQMKNVDALTALQLWVKETLEARQAEMSPSYKNFFQMLLEDITPELDEAKLLAATPVYQRTVSVKNILNAVDADTVAREMLAIGQPVGDALRKVTAGNNMASAQKALTGLLLAHGRRDFMRPDRPAMDIRRLPKGWARSEINLTAAAVLKEMRRLSREAKKDRGDKAATGGIDLAQANLDLRIKRDGKGIVLPVDQLDLNGVEINGLIPEILGIRQATAVILK